MDIIGFQALIVLGLIASNVSDAYLLSKLRKLATSTLEVSPVPSPVPAGGKSYSNSSKLRMPDNNNVSDSLVFNWTSIEKRNSSKYYGAVGPSSVEPRSTGKVKSNSKDVMQMETAERCKQSTYSCTDKNKMIACVEGLKGSKEMILRVQNDGESTLKVKLIFPASAENGSRTVQLLANQTTKFPIGSVDRSSKLVVDGGNGECVIHVRPVKYLVHPLYSELVTPINGTYLMLFTVLVFGGICCFRNFRRRQRPHGGVGAYQEVEMGGSANDTEEHWDDVWDEDWDEEQRGGTGNGLVVGTFSANGLTSRSFSKDG